MARTKKTSRAKPQAKRSAAKGRTAAKKAAPKKAAPKKAVRPSAAPARAGATAAKAQTFNQPKPSESTIEILGSKVFVRRGGVGEPLLFLHGAGGVPMWLPVFEQLAKSYHVIVPDHPLFGRSDTPEWLDDISDMAYFYLDLLEKLDLRNVHLVGNSLGGWIALEVAVRSAARLKSLTLVSAAGIHVKGVPKADIFMMNPEETARALYVDDKLIQQMIAFQPTPEQMDTIYKNRIATAKLGWQPRLFNPKLHKWLHRIKVPTHIVWGDSDKIIPPTYGDAFKKLISGSKLTVIPNSGHLPHLERTQPFVSAVTGFLGKAA
jgi:pimeloyl-ACP methyl ester carboxylesterase